MRVGGVATIASAPDAGRRAVTPRRHRHHHHRHHHRRRHGRSDAAAPTSSETSAVTREACYEFVRSGCKPRESFRYARTAATVNARTAAADAGRADAGREGSAVFASGVWARARMRVRDCDDGRNDPDGWTRGVEDGNATMTTRDAFAMDDRLT